jgi:hypothetical protein
VDEDEEANKMEDEIHSANKELTLQKSVSMFYREESEKDACL